MSQVLSKGPDSISAGLSPKHSIIGEFTKDGNLNGLRASANFKTKAMHDVSSNDKMLIDKKTYQELMNYIAKTDNRRVEQDKNVSMINIYNDASHNKIKPNSVQQKMKPST